MYLELYNSKTGNFTRAGIPLYDAYNVLIKLRVNAEKFLSFKIPCTSNQWKYIKKEAVIKADGQLYIIKVIKDGANEGKPFGEIGARHIFWEISEKEHLPTAFFYGKLPAEILSNTFSEVKYYENSVRLLNDSELAALGLKAVTRPTDVDIDKTNPIDVLLKIISNVSGEIYVDNLNFALVEQLGADKGLSFNLDKNLKGIERNEDTTQLVTRLFPYGKDGLEITSVNNGKAYIDSPFINDYAFLHKGKLEVNDIEIPESLLMRAEWAFSPENYYRIDIPKTCYKCSVIDLWKLAEFNESQRFNLGDYVRVHDECFNIDDRVRIVEYSYYPYEPQNSAVTLGNPPETPLDILEKLSGVREYYYAPQLTLPELTVIENTVNNIINDTVFNTIHEVVENKVLVSETAQILFCWIDELFVDYVETNTHDLNPKNPYPPGGRRNFIRIYNQGITFYSAKLSPGEVENMKTRSGEQVYYTAVDGAPQAYKYYTITDPIEVYPNKDALTKLSKENPEAYMDFIEETRERFRVKVRKTTELIRREYWGFDADDPNLIPMNISGSGDEKGNGVGKRYKGLDGHYFTYTTRVDNGDIPAGTEIGFRITDNGEEYFSMKTGKWEPLTSGTGIDIGNVNLVVQNHPLTDYEKENYPDNTLVCTYNLEEAEGKFGADAYMLAQRAGKVPDGMNESEWIDSLNGKSPFDVAKERGYNGTEEQLYDMFANVGNIREGLIKIIG